MKKCTGCGELKPLEEYHKSKRDADGRVQQCKRCKAEYSRKYRAENRDKLNAQTKRWHEDNRERSLASKKAYRKSNSAKVQEAKKRNRIEIREKALQELGGKCLMCGINDKRVLQIDHVDGGGSAERNKIGRDGIHRKVVRDGGFGYQLLCANCHAIKTYNERGE